MTYLNYPIFYLIDKDFDTEGNIINPNVPNTIPVVMMIQTAKCAWCIRAKPAYQQLADDYGYRISINSSNVSNTNKGNELAFFTTIHPGGEMKGEKQLSSIIPKIDKNFRGFPHYIVYNNGKRIPYEGNRSYEDLKKFLESLN